MSYVRSFLGSLSSFDILFFQDLNKHDFSKLAEDCEKDIVHPYMLVSLGTGLGTEWKRSEGAGWFLQRAKKIVGLATARNGPTVDQTRSWCLSAGISFHRFGVDYTKIML